jgi:serine protease Do
MHSSFSRWVIGVAAMIAAALLFYTLRTERPRPEAVIAPVAATPKAPASTSPAVSRPAMGTPQATQAASPPAGATASGPASATPDGLASSAVPQAPPVPNFVGLVQAVKPAVVSIRVKSDVTPQVTSSDGGANPFEGTPFERFFRQFGPSGREEQQGPQRRFYAQAQGSGFFISADGYVVTNNHVVANAVKLEVVMDDGKVLDAKVVGTDPKTDLALLKVEGQGFPFVSLTTEKPKIGEWVIAMGNPFGLGGTVTAGIVSAQGRDIGSGPYNDFLQIDAAVNRGNSGGPTFNMNARVIGVNTAIFSPSGGSVGIAFDIPATTVQPVVAQLRKQGYVERGWIGVQVQPVTKDIADSLGMQEAAGALVSATQPASPAAKAGLKAGDVITAINGAGVKDSRDLARQVAGLAPNASATIGYLREGKAQTATLTIGQLREQEARKVANSTPPGGNGQASSLGMAVAPASRVMGIGEQGLAVLRVDPDGKAAEVGLSPGDVILQVGGKDVSSPEDLVSVIKTASEQKKQHVLALVRRNDQEMFVALPVTG